jgi:hypothetical protein
MGCGVGLIAEAADGGEPAKPALGLKRTEDEARLKRVFGFFDQQKYEAALTELQPVLDAQPELVTMQELACELWARRAADGAETMAQCKKAGELAGAGPISWLHLARAQLATGAPSATIVQSLAKARAAFDAQQAPPFVWTTFADLALEQRSITWVETAATHVDPADAPALLAAAAKFRRWQGVPVNTVPAEQEGAVIKRVAEAQKRIALDEKKLAAGLVSKLEADLPTLPGTLAARCALDALNKKTAPAKKACTAALAAQSDNLSARLVSSELAKPAEAIAELTKIVDLDPTHDLSYRRLAELHRKRKDSEALQKLEERYHAQFKRPLPK